MYDDRQYAAGYARVSTEEQGQQGFSLAAQRVSIAAECERRGLQLVGTCEDVASGSLLRRHGLLELMGLLKEHRPRIRAVVVWKEDRLSRTGVRPGAGESALEYYQLLDDWRNKKIKLISATESWVEGSTPTDEMVSSMMRAINKFERDRIAERTTFVLAQRRLAGKRCSRFVPYGYVEVEGKLYPEEVQQRVLRKIDELHSKGWGSFRIATYLNNQDVPPRSGDKWSQNAVARCFDRRGQYPSE